jgi:hypothetical protein
VQHLRQVIQVCEQVALHPTALAKRHRCPLQALQVKDLLADANPAHRLLG